VRRDAHVPSTRCDASVGQLQARAVLSTRGVQLRMRSGASGGRRACEVRATVLAVGLMRSDASASKPLGARLQDTAWTPLLRAWTDRFVISTPPLKGTSMHSREGLHSGLHRGSSLRVFTDDLHRGSSQRVFTLQRRSSLFTLPGVQEHSR
jgi:hypothetical protein